MMPVTSLRSPSGADEVDRIAPTRTAPFWKGVYALARRADGPAGLLRHGLHMFVADDYPSSSAPPELLTAWRHSRVATLIAPLVLERARHAIDGPIVLMKGAEIGARYPEPWLRPFNDIDLLVEDPVAAQRALLASGFVEIGNPEVYADHHHLRPLQLPGFQLPIELHHRPSVMSWVAAPSAAELIADSIPSATGVDGISALRPHYHALLLAAHGWGHWPLGRALDLVDVLAASDGLDRFALQSLATSWNIEKVWLSTLAAGDSALKRDVPTPWTLRTWARHVQLCRTQTPFERRLTRSLSPFAALDPTHAISRALARIQRGIGRRSHGGTSAGQQFPPVGDGGGHAR